MTTIEKLQIFALAVHFLLPIVAYWRGMECLCEIGDAHIPEGC